MSDIAVQASFNAGEWAPALNARVDMQKYRAGAALLQNYFVDYRGGASSRPGTKYILQAYKSSTAIRLITFQAAFNVGYVLELGDHYVRFFFNGSPILESSFNIVGATQANPLVVSLADNAAGSATANNGSVSASYAPGDLVTLAGGTGTAADLEVDDTQLVSLAVDSPGNTTLIPFSLYYQPGDSITLAGGAGPTSATIRVLTTQVAAAYVDSHNTGTGGTPGPATVTGVDGTGTPFQANVTIGGGGGITAVNSISVGGSYTANPPFRPSLGAVTSSVSGGGLSGAALFVVMGVDTFQITNAGVFTANPASGDMTQLLTSGQGVGATFNTALLAPNNVSISDSGNYTIPPTNPVSQASTTGTGAGATFNVSFNNIAVSFVVGDWVFITGVVGMTELNGQYFSVIGVSGSDITLGDLNGNPIDSTGFGAYISGGTVARVYTIPSPWAAADLALVKFAQSVAQMIMCHPSYPPYVLTIVEPTNWTLVPAVFGTTADTPTDVAATSTLGMGSVNYSYVVTSIDSSGQESGPSLPASLTDLEDIRTVAGSNSISWSLGQNAVRYNVYESDVSYFGIVPAGVQYGYIGSTTGNTFIDSNIAPDFSISPPVSQNPFIGSGIGSIEVTAPGSYTTVPTIDITGGSPSIPASAVAQLEVQGVPTVTAGGSGYVVGDTISFGRGVILVVTTISGSTITAWDVAAPGAITSGAVPTNPVAQISTTGIGTGATATMSWGVGKAIILASGAGFSSVPTVSPSAGAATFIATLAPTSSGDPSVPGFVQQRLVLAAPTGAPQTFFMSQPGAFYNFDTTFPVQDDNAITESLVSGVLNTIKAIVSSTAGMLLLTDKASWIVNGGSSGSAITPTAIVANAQSFVGANDVPPIIANYDVLYIPSKGSGVRDLSFNIYFSVFTGTDISVLSSHLFFGFDVLEWAWAEQPFYTVWAVRNDGVMLSLAFLKEQDFIGWAHHTTAGNFKSVTVVTESGTVAGTVDAVYTAVERVVEGSTVKYIERIAERIFPNGVEDAWCVDAGLQYVGAPATDFVGAQHLAGLNVTGLADGEIIPTFVMPADGEFTLSTPASKVTIGLGFECDLQTLALDLGEPTVQGKVKKIPAVDVRVADTLGLEIGNDFNHLTPMKDLIIGNVSSMLTGQQSQIITNLVTGDARTILGPAYTVPGQYCVRQPNPYPSSILGVFPSVVIGDDSAR